MIYNQLADKATIYFECQTDFGRWVTISCITMSLFIVILYTVFMYVNKWLSFNRMSLDIFDRVPVQAIWLYELPGIVQLRWGQN